MNAEQDVTGAGRTETANDGRPDLSNSNVREDLAMTGRCALVHLPTGRTCLLPLRHGGPCEFHRPQEAQDVVAGGP
ncbi:hypothetical protein [Arthrobacter sp. SLBN-112]|jgi:hypothetical protein|uniref:hypothetical protein n=1 Tax=Arthrobacter sp. SLBN-112 TaxID=2768452 RepID=UPI0027B603C3|nr:hypothetical protein [Arthrobacter sp. SLBN-112]MDQ0798872.1 hypothetical protein [Arthrobacter sp. SLBN-112]